MVEPHPGSSSVLLGSWPHLCVASQTECHLQLEPSFTGKRGEPRLLASQHQRNVFSKQEGWMGRACANLKTMSTNPKRNSDSVANEGGDGVVLYANQRATCSWLWPSPTPSNPTPNRTNGSMCCCYTRLHDPPAIPIISGYFIISGCSHNSGLNGWCVLVHQLEQLRKKKR